MTPLTDAALRQQVEGFYRKVLSDETLAPIFAEHVTDWPAHLERLTDFWTSVMLTSGRYKGNPYAAHLPFASRLGPEMFERWLSLWSETARELFDDDAASQLEQKANRIAESLASGLLFRAEHGGAGRQISGARG